MMDKTRISLVHCDDEFAMIIEKLWILRLAQLWSDNTIQIFNVVLRGLELDQRVEVAVGHRKTEIRSGLPANSGCQTSQSKEESSAQER